MQGQGTSETRIHFSPAVSYNIPASTVYRHGDVLARLRGHGAEVAAVHFDPHKSHILASCAEDGMLKVTSLFRVP